MFKISEQFNDPGRLVKWFVPFTESDVPVAKDSSSGVTIRHNEYSVQIMPQNMFSTTLKSGDGKNFKEFLFSADPDTSTGKETSVTLRYRNSLFNEWFNKGELVRNARKSLDNLKDYMEDPRRLYGYDIQVTTVADTAFLFISETVPVTQKREATRRLFESLIDYAKKKNAGYTGVRILYMQQSANDLTLYASIGVSNKIEISPTEPFQYKLMPFGKKLLEANFQGPYGDVGKVYQALETFKSDHNLITMAIPFQKFMNEGYDFSDSQLVQMKVYYPIF
jgi:effector-binding domain-containing protein